MLGDASTHRLSAHVRFEVEHRNRCRVAFPCRALAESAAHWAETGGAAGFAKFNTIGFVLRDLHEQPHWLDAQADARTVPCVRRDLWQLICGQLCTGAFHTGVS